MLPRNSRRHYYTEDLALRWLVIVLIVVFAVLFFANLGRTGFLGPDEPRYASIGRDMARTGDWITPRLDGQPWFEKPPLIYWLTAIGHLARLPDEWAARFPQALISLGFFFLYFRILRAEFSLGTAIVATSILATSIGWLAFSFVAVTDLPMAATLNAAVLMALFPQYDPRDQKRRWLHAICAGALLGLSILGKGFVPLVLFVPIFFFAVDRVAILLAALMVAAPWYLLCWARNGDVFWNELFWKHHVARFFSPTLDHVQPFWYYVPILMAGIFPWTPLIALIGQEGLFEDVRLKRLGWWLLWGLAFFSAARNKLPGYILPLLPCLVILITIAFSRSPISTYWLAGCVWMAAWLPTAASVLPKALTFGLSRAMGTYSAGGLLLLLLISLLIVAVAALWLAIRINGFRAAPLLALAIAITIGVLLSNSAPRLDRSVSARSFYRSAPAEVRDACLDHVSRTFEYGLNYYARHPLPACLPGEPANRPRVTMADGKLVLK